MLVNFTLRQIAYFVTAAEAGSTARAAELLHLNQSSMSTALTDLESVLGVELFVRRRGKGLTLTAAGEELLPQARRALQAAEEFGQQSKALQHEDGGTLRIGCFDTIAPAYLPRLVSIYRHRYPGVDVEVLESGQEGLIEALETARIELALTYDHRLPATVEVELVARPSPHVLVHADHRLAGEKEVALSRFSDEDFVLIGHSPARELSLEIFEDRGITPRIVHSSSNFDHVRAMVHQGIGFTFISQVPGTTPPHWGDGVVAIPLQGPRLVHNIATVALKGVNLTRRARNFRRIAAEFASVARG